jgi:isoleucyl-tRNA synthetase
MLNNLQEYQNEPLEFKELTVVDKVMMCKLLSYSAKVTEAYDGMDLAKVYKLTQQFVEDTSNFYLEFSRERIYNSDKASRSYRSSIKVYSHLLQAIV